MNKTEIVLGIDIGGTNTAYGFIDQNGKSYFENSIPTNAFEPAECLFERLFQNIKSELTDEYNLVGIGIGAPNANYYNGTIENPPNLKWGFINVIDLIKKYYTVPAAITNDANAAAIGEMQFGAAKGMKDFIVITLGTGLGSGIVANGKLIYGHDGFAGEIGHTFYDINGRTCGCGRKGCLETYASATGIKRTVAELLSNSMAESKLRNIPYNELTAKMIADAALDGDEIALEAFEYTGKILGIKLADSVAHTSPEAIILFGGLALSGDLIFKPTKKYFEEYLLSSFKNKIKLLPSNLINGNSAILGSAALIWNEL